MPDPINGGQCDWPFPPHSPFPCSWLLTPFTFHSLLKSLSHTNHITVIYSLTTQLSHPPFWAPSLHPMLPITLLAKPFRSLTMFLLVVPKFVVAHVTNHCLSLPLMSAWKVPSSCLMKWLRGILFSAPCYLGCLFGGFVEWGWWACWMRLGNVVLGLMVLLAVLIVHDLCQASKVWEALWMLDELRSRGWKPDFMAFWAVAAVFWSMGKVADELKVLKMWGS